MASNRDPRKDYRINRRGRKVTSSSNRSARSKKASAPKPTSSSTRRRGRGTGSRRVTNDGLNRNSRQLQAGVDATRRGTSNTTRGNKLDRKIRNVDKRAAKVTESGGRTQRPPASNNNRKTNLKLQGTWAQKRAGEKAIDREMGINNRLSSILNDERLKMGNKSNSNEERAQRLQTRNKVVEGPKGKAVRKKPLTGGPRGAQGPASPESVKRAKAPVKKQTSVAFDIPQRTNKPATNKPPTPGVKFDPSKRVQTGAAVATLFSPRSDVPARLLAAGSLAKDVYDATRPKDKPKTKTKPTPGMDKGAVARAKADAAETNRQSKASSFDRAFAAARKAGKKTFTWKGKLYTTKLK